MYYLLAYKIDGQCVGQDLQTWEHSDLRGNPAFKFAETIETGYADISSVTHFQEFGHASDNDFKFVRDRMKDHVIDLGTSNILSTQTDPETLNPSAGDAYLIGDSATGAWSGKDGQVAQWDGSAWIYFVGDGMAGPVEQFGFTFIEASSEKIICATNLIGTVAQQLTAFGFDFTAKGDAQAKYKADVQICRKYRYKWTENNFLQQIPTDAGTALTELGMLGLYYRDQGIDGEFYGDPMTGMGDWVNGFGAFDGAGLINKPWMTLDGRNMTQYAAAIDEKLFTIGLTTAEQSTVNPE